jgi:hypothetical protein
MKTRNIAMLNDGHLKVIGSLLSLCLLLAYTVLLAFALATLALFDWPGLKVTPWS